RAGCDTPRARRFVRASPGSPARRRPPGWCREWTCPPSILYRPKHRRVPAPPVRERLLRKQGFDELVRVELLQVAHFLADADVPHGDLQRVADADDDAAFGGAVELGEDESGHAKRVMDLAGLLDGVLAGGGVVAQ